MKYYLLLLTSLTASASSKAAPALRLRATQPKIKITTSSSRSRICEVKGISLDIVPTIRDTVTFQLDEDLPQSILSDTTSAKANRDTVKGLSRTPGLIYNFGAVKCIVSGELHLIQENSNKVQSARAGECVSIPAGEAVSLVNYGEVDAINFSYNVGDSVERCELPPKDDPGAWEVGELSCSSCGDIYQKQCQLYDTCDANSPVTPNWEEPCLDECIINNETVPHVTWDVPDDSISVNRGKTIRMEPSWPVQGGHTGQVLTFNVDAEGSEFKYQVEKTVRLPNTRAVVHTHDYTGVTCLMAGEMTLLLDLVDPVTVQAPSCYWMPASRYMSGMNTGDDIAVMFDMFVLPNRDNAVSLNPKETFVNTPEERYEAQAYCDDPDFPPLVDETQGTCCDGTFVQNNSTAAVETWICPIEPQISF